MRVLGIMSRSKAYARTYQLFSGVLGLVGRSLRVLGPCTVRCYAWAYQLFSGVVGLVGSSLRVLGPCGLFQGSEGSNKRILGL